MDYHYDFDSVIDRRNTFSYKWDVPDSELPMWVADMDFRTAPEITAAITERASHGIFGYTTLPDCWYDAYIEWWASRHGIRYSKEQMIFSTGVIPTVSSCVRKLTTPAEKIILMTPVYNVFYNCILNNGRVPLECPLRYEDGAYSVDFDLLERAFSDPQAMMLLLCNPQNPTGKIWNRQTLARIGALAAAHGVIVLSDEIHCDLTMPGQEYVPYAAVSEICAGNCIICVSPTKTFNLAGLQTSAVIVPNPHIRHRVRRALNTDECAEPNVFAVQAAVAAFTKGAPWLDELRTYLFENRELVSAYLEAELPQIRLVRSDATYLLWLDCAAVSQDSRQLARYIRERTGLYLSNGAQYGGTGVFLRMNIACPRALLRDGLRRLKTAIDSLNRK